MVADVWEKDVWDVQAKSGSSGSCRIFLHCLRQIAVPRMSGKAPGSHRHPSSGHERPADLGWGSKGFSIGFSSIMFVPSFYMNHVPNILEKD